MSQASLELILDELRKFRGEIVDEFQSVRSEIQIVREKIKTEEQAKSLKEQIAEIAARQVEQEKRFSFQLHSQAASIEILHREQLALKTEIELLKSQR